MGWVAASGVEDRGASAGGSSSSRRRGWVQVLGVFTLFRFFDVLKPWPVQQSQCLHGGLGVTIDDVLAAVYVNLAVLLFYAREALPAPARRRSVNLPPNPKPERRPNPKPETAGFRRPHSKRSCVGKMRLGARCTERPSGRCLRFVSPKLH